MSHHRYLKSTMEEWRYIFAIGAVAYILPALIYAIYGSGEIQKWNSSRIQQQKDQDAVKSTWRLSSIIWNIFFMLRFMNIVEIIFY